MKELPRRVFVKQSCATLGSAWLAAHLPEILAAQEHAHRVANSGAPAGFDYLSPEQAAEIEAIAAQIIPTDQTPGAREARVIYFIDRAFSTFAASERPALGKGLKTLKSKVKKLLKTEQPFSALSSEQQIKVLKAIETTPFFELIRTMTVIGMFANSEYGGNHDQAGWKLIGFEDDFYYEPPFGFYDRETPGQV